MNKVGNDKTHLDIHVEENRLYSDIEENHLHSMTFRMCYDILIIPIDIHVYMYKVIP